MAITKIIPIRTTSGKSVDYICNPNKTENCAFVYSEHCFPKTASVEFDFYLRQAQAGGNTLGRHLIQSFSPEETTPEQAHEIGKRLAEKHLKGEYAFVMTTHVDGSGKIGLNQKSPYSKGGVDLVLFYFYVIGNSS